MAANTNGTSRGRGSRRCHIAGNIWYANPITNSPTQPKTCACPCAFTWWIETPVNRRANPICQSSQTPQLAPTVSATAMPAVKNGR